MAEEWCKGGTVNGARQLGTRTLDFSGSCPDIPAEAWCRGGTVNGARQLGTRTLDLGREMVPAPVVPEGSPDLVADRLRAIAAPGVTSDLFSKHLDAIRQALRNAEKDGIRVEIVPSRGI